MTRIMLSFSLQGSRVGKEVAQRIAAEGMASTNELRRWFADDVTIEAALFSMRTAAACVIVAVGNEINDDPWVAYEVGLANGIRKKVFLLMYDGSRSTYSAPFWEVAEVVTSISDLIRRLRGIREVFGIDRNLEVRSDDSLQGCEWNVVSR